MNVKKIFALCWAVIKPFTLKGEVNMEGLKTLRESSDSLEVQNIYCAILRYVTGKTVSSKNTFEETQTAFNKLYSLTSAVTASPSDETWRNLLSFTRTQSKKSGDKLVFEFEFYMEIVTWLERNVQEASA